MGDYSWVGIVTPFQFGLPTFEISSIIALLIVGIVIMTETTGDIVAVGEIVDEKITPRKLAERLKGEGAAVLDVREESAFKEGHIPGARHVHAGRLEEKLDDLGLDRDEPVAVTCSVGHRGGLAASLLARAGYTNVSNLLGGMTAWNKLDLPTEKAA